MQKTMNFLGKGKTMLSSVVLLATLFSCSKEDLQDRSLQNDSVQVQEESLSAISTNSRLIFEETFESTTPWTGLAINRQFETPHAFTVASSPVLSGSKSGRFELRDGDPMNNSGTRAEVSFPEISGSLDRWYAFSAYFPSNDYKYDDEDELINQWHQGGGVSPSLTLGVKMDRYRLIVKPTATTSDKLDLGPVAKDKWNTFVFHVKHSSGADGILEVWLNGVKVVNRKGVNMYELSSGTYKSPKWKLGIYKSDWNREQKTLTTKRVLYFDNVRIGNSSATYADMTAGSSTTAPAPAPTPAPAPAPKTESDPTGSTITAPSSRGAVTSFTLVNVETGKDIMTLANGATISLSKIGVKKLNIRANTGSPVGSIKFEVSGRQNFSTTDRSAPYALQGDNGAGTYYYRNWNPPALGTYKLTTTPYSGINGKGIPGTSSTISFTFVQ